MARRVVSLLIALAVMVCLGAMTPGGACADTPTAKAMQMHGTMAMTGPTAGRDDCAHHRLDRGACHGGCDICAGVDAPRLFVLRHEVYAAPTKTEKPQSVNALVGVPSSGLDRPPKRNG